MAVTRRKIRKNNKKVNWENDTKEQPYLMPGSPEYEEYQNDLRMHDPFRPDDAWHDELEEHNEEIQVHTPNPAEQNTSRWKSIRQQSKRVRFETAKKETMKAAALTESQADDKKASKMKLKDLDEMTFDDGVNGEEYVSKTIRKYID